MRTPHQTVADYANLTNEIANSTNTTAIEFFCKENPGADCPYFQVKYSLCFIDN